MEILLFSKVDKIKFRYRDRAINDKEQNYDDFENVEAFLISYRRP